MPANSCLAPASDPGSTSRLASAPFMTDLAHEKRRGRELQETLRAVSKDYEKLKVSQDMVV